MREWGERERAWGKRVRRERGQRCECNGDRGSRERERERES